MPRRCFFVNWVSKRKVLFRNEIWLCEKTQTFITVFTTIYWMKPAWPAGPIFLTLTLLMGGPAGRRWRSRLVLAYAHNVRRCSLYVMKGISFAFGLESELKLGLVDIARHYAHCGPCAHVLFSNTFRITVLK